MASRRARTRPQTAPRLASIHVVSKVAAVSPPASSLDHPKARPYDRKRIILVVSSVKGRVPTRVVGAKPTGLVIPPTVVDKITAIKASVRYMTRRTAPSPTRAWPIYTAEPVAARRRTMLSTSRASRMPYFVARSRFVTRSPLNTVLHPYALRKSRKRAKVTVTIFACLLLWFVRVCHQLLQLIVSLATATKPNALYVVCSLLTNVIASALALLCF